MFERRGAPPINLLNQLYARSLLSATGESQDSLVAKRHRVEEPKSSNTLQGVCEAILRGPTSDALQRIDRTVGHASKSWTTWPCTSVKRKSRPA